MRWRSPAKVPAVLLALAVTAAAAISFTNCTDNPPDEASYSPTAPQLAVVSPCTSTPCVRVTVSFKGGDPPTVPVVVTLVHVKTQDGGPGVGPFDELGEPLMLETDPATGVITFQPDGVNGRTLLPGYYCGHARPLTAVSVATGGPGGTFVVPNAEAPPQEAAKYIGVIATARGRESVLNGPNYIDCLRDPPLVVTESSTLNLSWTMNAATASLDVLCRFFDGATENDCATWAIYDLSELLGTEDEPAWWKDRLEEGVKPGLLVSAARANASRLYGLPLDELVQVEAALEIWHTGDNNEEFTASLKDKPTPKANKKSSTSQSATAFMDPLVCVDYTEPDEPEGDATSGIDFLTVHDGYLGKLPLDGATFVVNPYRTAAWYNQLDLGGSQNVKIHMRFKPNPDSPIPEDPTLPETISRQFTVDFSGCPNSQPSPALIEDEVVTVRVECRTQNDSTRVTWSFGVLGSRTMEYRLEVVPEPGAPGAQYDTHPGPARSGEGVDRAMRYVGYTSGACPLAQSTISQLQSNDPKWAIPN
ncbi:MAG: hypothetical protein JSV86_17545 [Gemmatimonadota bacterium]|nr:MAG: hypothetical protein JSV86_17545 [Gemmatimonadota bacterium]